MALTPDQIFIRRRRMLGVLAAWAAAPRAWAVKRKVVTILGDSITAGFGLPERQALPAQLQAALARLGAPAAVRGAGVSGDTSAEGLARLDFSVQGDTDVCVVALGANDLLQGFDPGELRDNLEAIVKRLKSRRIGVLVAGLSVPAVVGASYAHDVEEVFPAVARAQHVTLYPDLLAGVAGNPALRQGDGLHPNAAGVKVIAARLAPVVAHALRSRA